MKTTEKIEQAKVKFESIVGQGFFEITPVETFRAKKEECPYYFDGKIFLNTTGFVEDDLFHEAAHAIDDLIFVSAMDFSEFFRPFYRVFSHMSYFREFLESYSTEDRAHECFAEAFAMSICYPEWEDGARFQKAVIRRIIGAD